MLSAFPLLFLDLKFNIQDQNLVGPQTDEWQFGRDLLFNNNVDRVIFWGRIPIILLSVLLGLYIFKWGKELFNYKAGVIGLFIYDRIIFCFKKPLKLFNAVKIAKLPFFIVGAPETIRIRDKPCSVSKMAVTLPISEARRYRRRGKSPSVVSAHKREDEVPPRSVTDEL